ncbi:MAG: extracellular solute-binding protein [Victivallales bacterium]|jgi:raffinose/stachyose/melibiose transport system substrate-binding protein
MKYLEFLKRYYSLIIVLVVYVIALGSVAFYRYNETPPGTIVLRIGHWQLETGVRDGLNEMAKEYQKTHPNVRIIQDAIPEGTYGQWLSTQIMAGTAPDLLEIGMVPYQVTLSFYNRYCMTITPYVNKPNPYNKGNELADVPLRNTIKDGMSSVYIKELQEYMQIPLSCFTTRVFYNADLLKKLTGSAVPPKNYREFYDMCGKVSKMRDEKGRPYIPVVGSKYHFGIWEMGLCNMMTYGIMKKADLNRDGYVGNDELFVAVKSGIMDLGCRELEAKYQMVREIADFCQPGFTGLSRDEGVFLFAQKRALFMTTGTWDAMSLQEQAKGNFTVAVMDFPMPSKDDPEYGDVVAGPRYENPGVGFNFSVTRTSKHPEIALDFLLFMAAKENNEKLNKIIGWIPATINTETTPLLNDFKPCLEGIYGNFEPNLGGETWIKWLQLGSLYQVNPKFTFKELIGEFEPFYKDKGYFDFVEWMKDKNRVIPVDERLLAGIRAQAMLSKKDSSAAETFWVKYRSQTRERQIFQVIWNSIEMIYAKNGSPFTKENGPYEYSPKLIEKVKARVKAEKK